ncbi:hypothetical protein [Streptomyces sp. NBC_01363]|uniref:hypothetical protein n=1 Tax=Streptomyces sp. NBC_01363 TaxID=2903840 RepID=UPI00225636BF|nr:hypothetical protein [Streptomyces sp. NBC_01363]MCX4732721.1 hypothetical protein [Streptomyces sp. NBC_01363]
MRRRITAFLVALAAVLGLAVAAPQPAAADKGLIGGGVSVACKIGSGPLVAAISKVTDFDLCEKVGAAVDKKVNEAWKAVWDSALGDILKSAADVAKWLLKKVLTVALLGPSVDLAGIGLFGRDATLAGMLVWLGLVVSAFGVIWQLGKMAITGQAKHAWRAASGWAENVFLSACGVGMFALFLVAGDALTSGLVDAVFDDDGKAFERIVAVMVPMVLSNPVTLAGVLVVLLLVGFIQLIMVFLRQSAIPIICLLLPVAGGGRAGGDATRQWAPKLITSGLVIVAYKPMLAVIICTGFAEFGHSGTLAEWLRGCATLLLAVLAPGPLTRIFAPFGAAVGGGLAVGGASGALSAAAGYLSGSGKDGGDGGEGGEQGDSPVQHAQFVQQSMGSQNKGPDPDDPDDPDPDDGPGPGRDVQAQAARNDSSAQVPAQSAGEGADLAVAGTGGTGTVAGTGASAEAGAAIGGPVGVAAAVGIEVIDGVNNTIQSASGEVGGGAQ